MVINAFVFQVLPERVQVGHDVVRLGAHRGGGVQDKDDVGFVGGGDRGNLVGGCWGQTFGGNGLRRLAVGGGDAQQKKKGEG